MPRGEEWSVERGAFLVAAVGALVVLSSLPAILSDPPEPIVSVVDLHFAPPGLEMLPGTSPRVGDAVRIVAHVALDGRQEWNKMGVVLAHGGPGDMDALGAHHPFVLYADGEYKMWYVGYAGASYYIMFANSSDGVTWDKHGAVLGPGAPPEDGGVHHPFVMKNDTGYTMWYSGWDGARYRIFHATSPDGLSWTRKGLAIDVGGPYDGALAYSPFVLLKGTYTMWYSGYDGTHLRVLYATSADGVSWTKRGVALDLGPPGSGDAYHAYAAWLLKEGGGYHMWYMGRATAGDHDRIYYATSPDAVNWTRRGMVLESNATGDLHGNIGFQSVVHRPGRPYQMWYALQPESASDPRILYATLNATALPAQVGVDFFLDSAAAAGRIGGTTVPVGALDGATAEIPWTAGPAGNHTVFAVIDPQNLVTERDETNNTASLAIQVAPAPLTADAGGPYSAPEGSPITLDGSGSAGPPGVPLRYRWDFESDGAWDTTWSADPAAVHVWGDDWAGNATLEVTDGNSTASASARVEVANVPPSLGGVRAAATANLTLRVAGEKWHDVVLEVVGPSGVIANASVTRHPGSPDDQRATVAGGPFDLLGGNVSVVVRYTPWDDPVNGQPNGATPVWVILTAADGTEVWIHHTFNVRHPETWNWTVPDVRLFLLGFPLRFEATAHDPGSDDLTFAWSWGDGTADTVTTVYNDGVGPDPHPSPSVNPITVTDVAGHGYAAAGTYTVTLTVTDDDGGTASATFDVSIG